VLRNLKHLLSFTAMALLVGSAVAVPPQSSLQLSGNGRAIFQGNDPASDTDTGTNFGTVQQGQTAHPHVFSLWNIGQGVLKVNEVTITGANASDFIISVPPANLNVGHNSLEPFTVVFSPTGVGARTASLNVLSNDPTNPTYTVNLLGTGSAAPPVGQDLRVTVKAKPKYSSATPGLVALKGKVTIYNVGTTSSVAGILHVMHENGVPTVYTPDDVTQIAFPGIPAVLPGKKPKKVKIPFSVTFTSDDHGAFFRAEPTGSDLDFTDNFTAIVVEPK
jgi:hypothetical protein